MTLDQTRTHAPRQLIPEDRMLARFVEPCERERPADRGFVTILAVVFVLVIVAAVIGGALQAMALAHIEEVIGG